MGRRGREASAGGPAARVLIPELRAGVRGLDADEAHYVRRVLRLREGDPIAAFDGRGLAASGHVVSIGRDEVRVEMDEPAALAGPPVRLTVAMAHPKGERADWVVEKLTEVGVARVQWVTCARSVVEPGEGRLHRQRRLALAAARQCGRADLPALEGPVSFARAVAENAGAEVRWIADPAGGLAPVTSGAPNAPTAPDARGAPGAVVLVGPEGGFDADEVEMARAANYTAVRLGAWILRVETAAVVAAATLLQRLQ